MKIKEKELTGANKEETRRNIVYDDDGDFRSTLIAVQYRYRASSPKLRLNQSEAGNFCQNRSSKLAEIRTEFEKNVLRFLLTETTAEG